VTDLLPARGTREAPGPDHLDETAAVFRALGDPARLRLMALIVSAGGESCVCDLTADVGLSQPTVSHHLATLVRVGLLSRDKRGVWAWYRTDPARLELVREVLATLAASPVAPRSQAQGPRAGGCA
jgi:ArsR family transcriptional regulator